MYKAMITAFFMFIMIFAPAFPSNAASTLSMLTELGEALEAGAKAIAEVGNSVRALAVSGGATYDLVAARRARGRLLDYQARSVDLALTQQTGILSAIENYVQHPSEDEWETVRSDVSKTLVTVQDLLEDVKKERSDFVTEKTYSELMAALHGRLSILHKLADLPAPSTKDELKALRKVRDNYRRLVENLGDVNRALGEYIKTSSGQPK